MTVSELIRQLQAMPQHMSVRVVTDSVYVADESGECECNQFGAVSVRAEDGHMLGIKPAEFEPVTWRAA